MIDVHHTFLQALSLIESHFATASGLSHVSQVTVSIVDARGMAQSLGQDCYRTKSRIPAYYNPNNHTIYLNQDILENTPRTTLLNICYHELVHAVSKHHTWREGTKSFFQSGLKLEIYHKQSYICRYRALNEGVVQYFTNTHTEATEPAYQKEVAVVTKLVQALGEETVRQASIEGNISLLQEAFALTFPHTSLDALAELLDRKKYDTALSILDQPIVITFPTPALVAQTVAAN